MLKYVEITKKNIQLNISDYIQQKNMNHFLKNYIVKLWI